jgi:serine/threonine protein kinase
MPLITLLPPKIRTGTVPMTCIREPDAEPIPGYKLIEPLGSGGFGEVWKCEAPGGILKAIKFVFGNLIRRRPSRKRRRSSG